MEYSFTCSVPLVILSSKATGCSARSLKLRMSATTDRDIIFGKGIEAERADNSGFVGIIKVQCSHKNTCI